MHTQSLREIAISRVQEFLDETGMPPWRLGVLALGDNKFWRRLRDGDEIKLGIIAKVEAFINAERAARAEQQRIADALEVLLAEDGEAVQAPDDDDEGYMSFEYIDAERELDDMSPPQWAVQVAQAASDVT